MPENYTDECKQTSINLHIHMCIHSYKCVQTKIHLYVHKCQHTHNMHYTVKTWYFAAQGTSIFHVSIYSLTLYQMTKFLTDPN